jgi:ankyrin repeat protein
MGFFNRPPKPAVTMSDADIFCAAILTGDANIVRSAIQSGVDVNKPGARGTPPVVLASVMGFNALVQLLVSAGADVNQPDRSGGITALQGAAQGGHAQVVRTLIAAGANLDAPFGNPQTTALSLALRQNHWPAAEALVEAGANVNVNVEGPGSPTDRQGITPLILAASLNNVPFVKLLINHNADLERRKADGVTALIAAAFNGHLEVVSELVKAAADVAAAVGNSTQERVTAIDIARARGHLDVVEFLEKLN